MREKKSTKKFSSFLKRTQHQASWKIFLHNWDNLCKATLNLAVELFSLQMVRYFKYFLSFIPILILGFPIGGTTVPLEKNTVRFIDNFSSGARGAASAEHFLAVFRFPPFYSPFLFSFFAFRTIFDTLLHVTGGICSGLCF